MSNLATLEQSMLATADIFQRVRVDDSINFEREVQFAMQVLAGSEFLTKTAIANPQSLIDSITNVSSIGISLNPARKQAYLVPRKGVVCLDISVFGLCDLAMATGAITWVQVECVYEKDTFVIRGMDQMPEHNRNPFAKDRGPVVGAYCTIKLADGDYLTHTIDVEKIHAIRDRSESFKSGNKSPWKTDYVEMCRKTVVKQASKYWPRIERLQNAVHHLNTEGGEGIDFNGQDDKPKAPADLLPRLLAEVAACTTAEEVTAAWKRNIATVQATGDMDVYNAYKAEVGRRGTELKNATATDVQAKPVATLLDKIKAANNGDELLPLGDEIDKQPEDEQAALNTAYNDRMIFLKL